MDWNPPCAPTQASPMPSHSQPTRNLHYFPGKAPQDQPSIASIMMLLAALAMILLSCHGNMGEAIQPASPLPLLQSNPMQVCGGLVLVAIFNKDTTCHDWGDLL